MELASRARFDFFTRFLDVLPEAGRPPEVENPYGGLEKWNPARTRHRSLCNLGALTCLRVQSFDSLHVAYPSDFVLMGPRFLEVELLLTARYLRRSTAHAMRRYAPNQGA